MASFKAKFPVLQELFAKNHRGPFAPPPPSGASVNQPGMMFQFSFAVSWQEQFFHFFLLEKRPNFYQKLGTTLCLNAEFI